VLCARGRRLVRLFWQPSEIVRGRLVSVRERESFIRRDEIVRPSTADSSTSICTTI